MTYKVTYTEHGFKFDALFHSKQEALEFVDELKDEGCKNIKLETYVEQIDN